MNLSAQMTISRYRVNLLFKSGNSCCVRYEGDAMAVKV